MSVCLGIDKLIDPLRTTIQSKAKANSVKQEFEKQDELKRSAMRAITSLLSITDSGTHTHSMFTQPHVFMHSCACMYLCVCVTHAGVLP